MKLILTQEVSGLGAPGDVVDVKPGYGRNFLIPRGFAIQWTKGGEKEVSSIRRARESRSIADLETAGGVKTRLESTPVKLVARAGDGGRLFGAVTPTDIAEAIVVSGGPQVDKRRIEVTTPIKTIGVHTVSVRLHPEVTATVNLQVTSA